jgi:hypothetical protein
MHTLPYISLSVSLVKKEEKHSFYNNKNANLGGKLKKKEMKACKKKI